MVSDTMASNADDPLGNLDQLCSDCELAELDTTNGVIVPEMYSKLMATYLLQNDVVNAKFLWKRIPYQVKMSNQEISWLWEIGQCLWRRDFAGVYNALKKEWSADIRIFATAIEERLRRRALELIARAYSTINLEEFCKMVGLSDKDAFSLAASRGWEYDVDEKVIRPSKPEAQSITGIPVDSEQQLKHLTDYATYLEN